MAKKLELAPYGVTIYLVKNQEDFDKASKKLGLNKRPWLDSPEHAGCTMSAHNGSVLFVSINPEANIPVTLAHEAVHVMRCVWENLNEHKPGNEASAYLVDWIVEEGLKYYEPRNSRK